MVGELEVAEAVLAREGLIDEVAEGAGDLFFNALGMNGESYLGGREALLGE